MLGLPAILLFTLEPLIGPRALPHWSMPGWLFLFPLAGEALAGAVLAGKAWPRRWAAVSAAVLVVVGALAVQEAATGWMGRAFPKVFKKGDPTAEAIEWSGLRGALTQRGLLKAPGDFVVALKWSEAGKIDEGLAGAAPVLVFSNDPREFAYRQDSSAFLGRDALILARPGTLAAHMAELRGDFHDLTPLPPIEVGREGHGEIEVDALMGHDLLRRDEAGAR